MFAAIQEAGLNVQDFRWSKALTDASWNPDFDRISVPVLVHEPTHALFKFDIDTGRSLHVAYFEPGEQMPQGSGQGGWPRMLALVSAWLEYVKREFEAPELWRELEREREVIGGMAAAENSPFSPAEQTQIAEQLRELKEFVRANYQLNGTQLGAIDSRLDYLSEAATRLGRLDWRNLMVGALLGLVVEAVVPPEPIRAILGLIVRGLGHLFGGGGLPELPLT